MPDWPECGQFADYRAAESEVRRFDKVAWRIDNRSTPRAREDGMTSKEGRASGVRPFVVRASRGYGPRRPIERSNLRFGRNVFVAGLVFTGMLCANLLIFGHLASRDLGNRMRKEATSAAQARAGQIARDLAGQGQFDLYRRHEEITTLSEYISQVLTREHYVRSVTLYDAADRPIAH